MNFAAKTQALLSTKEKRAEGKQRDSFCPPSYREYEVGLKTNRNVSISEYGIICKVVL